MRSDMKTSPPPNQVIRQPKGKEKRPWSKPHIRVIEVNFTASGFHPDPNETEAQPYAEPPGATYRTS